MPGLREVGAAVVHTVADGPRRLSGSYRRFRYELDSSYLRNPESSRRFRASPPALNEAQSRAVRELRERGIAITDVRALGVDPAEWDRLRTMVEAFSASERVREHVRRFPELVASGRHTADAYLAKLQPEAPTLPADDPLLRVGLGAPVLDVVNSYLKLFAKLVYTDVWHSVPVDVGTRIGSQRWHRDPEDRHLVKVYLYFNEVGPGAGPMEYIPGSCPGGPYEAFWPWRPRGARYPADGELERALPTAEHVVCTGSPGTLIFCDTDGFHRGGIATTGPRIAATWTFVTPASISITARRRYEVDYARGRPPQTEAARFALR